MESEKEFDPAFICVVSRTKDTERIYEEVTEAISFLPIKLKKELVEFGVRIVVACTTAEAFALTRDAALLNKGHLKGGEYSSSTKTIYIAQGKDDPYGGSAIHDVLVGCAYACNDLKRLGDSGVLHDSVEYDREHLTEELRSKFESNSGKEDPVETYALLFSHLLVTSGADPKSPEGKVFAEVEMAFPATVAFIRKLLTSFE